MKKEEYDQFYSVMVCPYCNHSKYTRKGGGLFSINTPYKCSKCSREFESLDCMSVVPERKVIQLVQDGINKKISKKEMIDGFKEIGISLWSI